MAGEGLSTDLSVLDPVVQEYDGIASSYDSVYEDGGDRAENAFLASVLHRASHEVPAPLDVVDFGCGTGLVADLLRYPFSYTGVDLSEGMLAEARRKHPKQRFIHGDMLGAYPSKGSLLTCVFGSANYVDLTKLARRMAMLTRSGGQVILMPFSSRRYRRSKEIAAGGFATPATAQQVANALSDAGLIEVSVTGFSDPSLDWMRGKYMRVERKRPNRCVWLLGMGVKA